MIDIFDYRKVATDLVQKALDRSLGGAEKLLKRQWAAFKNRDPDFFVEYLCRKASQINSVRNLIYYTRGVPLYDIFVPTRLAVGSLSTENVVHELTRPAKVITNPTDTRAERPTKALVIAGRAGTGKSLFMRHSFFAVQQEGEKRIPIFLELRTFNRSDLTDVEAKIQQDFLENGTTISREQITLAAEAGLFIVLLDGFDELRGVIFSHYQTKLLDFVRKYPLCPVVVSTRLFNAVYSWAPFEIRRLSKLSLEESDTLISKLDFDLDTKDRFRIALRNRLYRDFYEFASNPLLCTVMLLTYSYHGRISRSRHEFLEDAYQTLWSKHDDRKSGFERHRYTKLSKKDFGRLLAGLAFSSYYEADYEMTENEYNRHFERACDLTGVACEPDDFRRDLTLSTCLALEDGPVLEFCHRSLHEYFAACFICEMPDKHIASVVNDVSDRIETDSVLPLVRSINEEKIEKHWILPQIPSILAKINRNRGSIQKYGELLAEPDEGNASTVRVLEMIRILYEFEPTQVDLVAAYCAARDMRNPELAHKTLSKDRGRFVDLFDGINAKYVKKGAAMEKLLRRKK